MLAPVHFDVCIVGAGPAGSASACLLARLGLSVALIDRAVFPRDKTCGDGITPRGTRVLARLGVLDAVRKAAFACNGVTVRASETTEFTIAFDRGRAAHDEPEHAQLLVLQRVALDDLLLRHAVAAGAIHVPATRVVAVEERDMHCEIVAHDGRRFTAPLAVLATGAESQLLRACGLLAAKPPLEHAARAYFENVAGLADRVVLFFDGVDLPGYGWIFPTSPTSANIGCGVFARTGIPQAQRLKQLIATHPALRMMLAGATQAGPIKAYPLRTDFKPAYSGRGRVLVAGEAAGLVNPITGEGIDYALESAEFLADAIAAHWRQGPVQNANGNAARALLDAVLAERIAIAYRARLTARFARRFALYRAVQRHALTPARMPSLLADVARTPALQRLVIDGLFGRAKLTHLFKPSTLYHGARLIASTSR